MVKNSTGGNKAKGFARKNYSNSSSSVRLSTDPSEIYAKVTKLFGGGRGSAISSDGNQLVFIIRGKFSGKNKYSNIVSVGSFILVGARSFASCDSVFDLLHIYNIHDSLPVSFTSEHEPISFDIFSPYSIPHDNDLNLELNLELNLDLI